VNGFFIFTLARMRFLFLYTEIAEYFIACCNQLTEYGDVHIIRWPVNKEAPFHFSENTKLKIYSKPDYDYSGLENLINEINPTVIICSGWIDKDYLRLTKKYFKIIPTVMTCDTHWRGDFKQKFAMLVSRFTLLNIFSHAWVPGDIQKKYVLNLGFKESHIEKGFYSCDLDLFETIYQNQREKKHNHFPKRFIYVGRYYDFKGIQELWKAFIEFQNEEPNEWELWCLGIGDIQPVQHAKIKHFGFVQPKDLETIIAQAGVFVLPSRNEPWGVVVHEYAASGFPLLLSNQVGANDEFLIEEKNGFVFEAENVSEIKNALRKITKLTTTQLIEMSEVSNIVSKSNSPKIWANRVSKFRI
jgi:glycosyltransferase involved in cell wall biosynthesis